MLPDSLQHQDSQHWTLCSPSHGGVPVHLDLELDAIRIQRGLAIVVNGLVTKLQQVNKTVFVFFPSFNSFPPGWMTASCLYILLCLLHLTCLAYCILCNKLHLSLCKEFMLFMYLQHLPLNNVSNKLFYLGGAKKINKQTTLLQMMM